MSFTPNDPRLLTPGPLTTSQETKIAMLHDWGSRDPTFLTANARVRQKLLEIAGATSSHVCVPLQGSGTFTVEAVLGTLISRSDKALVLVNGAYGQRMTKMLGYMQRAFVVQETPEDSLPDLDELQRSLTKDTSITHVLVVHCETTSGILNPVEQVAEIVAQHKRSLIIDAMSAFGAIPLDAQQVQFDAVMASSNKCLEGVPGMGYAILRREVLEQCKGNAHSLSLDLYDQWQTMEASSQWRFTPPTHVLIAFDKAIEQFEKEGGVAGRNTRYSENCRTLVSGMTALGFEPLLPPERQAPIIVTFRMPADPNFDFQTFYDRVKERGYILYPGKLTVAPSFRVGCIGHLQPADMQSAVDAMKAVLVEMGVACDKPA